MEMMIRRMYGTTRPEASFSKRREVTDLDGKKLDFLQGTKLLKNRGILATVPEEYPKILDVLRNLKFIVCYS